ncbi:MAG: hypothetical protein ACR2GN_03990, partial [Bacteroidia bacterium]
MEKINKENYEAFFLDYYEGNLNRQKSEELFQFLELNPDLKTEFSAFENFSLEKEEIFFDDKNSLIKPEVNHFNYQNYLIAETEGDLNENEARALDNFIKLHPEYNKEKEIYRKLKSTPDESVYFELQEKIKKEEKKPVGKIIYLYRSIAVAASVLLAAFLFMQINNSNNDQSIAKVDSKKPQELKVDNNNEAEKQINSNPFIEPEEEKYITEQKMYVKKESDKNKKVIEERQDIHVAYTGSEKVEPVIRSEV